MSSSTEKKRWRPFRLPEMKESSQRDFNIFILSLGFFLLFLAFFTMGNIQTVILENAQDPTSSGYEEDFSGSGYVSLAIIYAVAFAADLFSSAAISALGARATLMLGSLAYALFIASFYLLEEWILYTASAVQGVGAALTWVAQGTLLSHNSTPSTIERNTGIFYVAFMSCGVAGNTFSYFQFRSDSEIDADTRLVFVSVLLVVACAGALTFLLLLPTPWVQQTAQRDSPKQGFVKAMRLLVTRKIFLLSGLFIYDGLEFSFYTGVLGPSYAFALSFGRDDNSLTGLHGIMVHAGAMAVGLIFALFASSVRRVPRWAFMAAAVACHYVCYALTLANVPASAPLGRTDDDALLVVPSSVGLALTASLFLGLGTGFLDTQVFAFIGSIYSDEASQAFAVLKMFHHSTQSAAYAYAGAINLYWQLGILFLFGSLALAGYAAVDIVIIPRENRTRFEEQGNGERGGDN